MATPSNKCNLDALLQHGGWVRALARSLVNDQATAEDFEQKTWLAAVEHSPGKISNPRAWLGTVMRNIARMHWREQGARRRREDFVSDKRREKESRDGTAEQPDHLVERVDVFRNLALALANLSEPYQTVLYLRFFEELKIREIAERMKVPESATQKRLARGLDMLRGQLESSLGKDWRQHCLIFTVPFASVSAVASSTAIIMTMKTKLFLGAAILALLALPFLNSRGDFEADTSMSDDIVASLAEEAASSEWLEDTVIHRENAASVVFADSSKAVAPVQVTVVDVDGRGIENASVFAWLGEELQEEVLTNEAGQVTLTGLDGSGGLVALAPHFLPVFLSESFDGTPIIIRPDSGESIGGRIRFLRPRTESTPLVIRVITSPFPKFEAMPAAVAKLLEELDVRPGFTDAIVDAHGNFRVSGLPRKWAGRIRLPRGFMISSFEGPGKPDLGSFIELFQSSASMKIELLELPVFTGRIVTLNGGAGVANTGLYVSPNMATAFTTMPQIGGRTDQEGFFRIPMSVMKSENVKRWSRNPELAFKPPATIGVRVFPTDHHAGATEIIDLSTKANPWDLGIIPVDGLAIQPILVVDSDNKPIEGALAIATRLSEPTNSLGLTDVAFGEDTETIFIGATGFQSVEVPLPASQIEPLMVALKPAAQLHVTWDVPEGFDMSALAIRVESDGDLFLYNESSRRFSEMRFRESAGLGFSIGGGSTAGGRHMQWHLKPLQNEFFIWGLKPGVAIKAMLVDRVESNVASSSEMVFSAGESREANLHIQHVPWPLVGRVVDSSGAPVSAAELSVEGSRRTTSVKTTPEGFFELPCLLGPTVSLGVKKHGYSNWDDAEFPVPPGRQPVEIVLEKGREMTIYLRDAAGIIYSDGYLNSPGTMVDRETDNDLGFLLVALPQEAFEIQWGCGGAKGFTQVPADTAELEIEVPAMASAVFHSTRSNAEKRQSVKLTFVPSTADSQASDNSFFQRSSVLNVGEYSKEKEISTLLPGEYIVKYSTFCQTDGQWGYQPLGEQGPVSVAAGQVLELELIF